MSKTVQRSRQLLLISRRELEKPVKVTTAVILTIAWMSVAGQLSAATHQQKSMDSAQFLTPKPAIGQEYGTVFSIAFSIKGDGFDELVRRNSGTGVNVTTAVEKDKLTFSASVRYDGQPVGNSVDKMSRDGKTGCWGSVCHDYTDASGLLYNELLWGRAPSRIHPGESWDVAIEQPWELGPTSKQRVTVIHLDPIAHTATLMRQGEAAGPIANEQKQVHITRAGKTYLVDVVPGVARWRGYTTFLEGFVQSDELVMERPVKLVSAELGELDASERIYMLLNAMPRGSV